MHGLEQHVKGCWLFCGGYRESLRGSKARERDLVGFNFQNETLWFLK